MVVTWVLIDYHNVAPKAARWTTGAAADSRTYEDHDRAVSALTGIVLGVATALRPAPSSVVLRYYGGWSDSRDGTLTDDGGAVTALARRQRGRYGQARFRSEIALAPVVLPGRSLGQTVIRRAGVQPFRMSTLPTPCVPSDGACLVGQLDQWRKGACPKIDSCGVTIEDATHSFIQKGVDTMLVSDMIALGPDTASHVVAVSNDDDVVPGVITRQIVHGGASLLRIRRRDPGLWDELLSDTGVSLHDLRD